MNYPAHVERRHDPAHTYAEQALRHAPEWVLKAVRENRARRGLPPLACTATAKIGSSPRIAPPATVKSKPTGHAVLVGICAPFASRPCTTPQDARQISERFSATAWRSIIEETRGRTIRPVVLRAGHDEEVLASMADGNIDLRLDPLVGAWFVARATTQDARRLRMLVDDVFGCGVSITFGAATARDVTTSRGLTVREILGARLADISLVPSAGDARAFYEGARAYLATGDTPEAIAAAFARAKDWATRYGLSRI